MVVDDGLVLGTDVVSVLEDTAQHQAGDAVDAQPQRSLGQGFEDSPDGIVHHVVHPLDEAFDKITVIVTALIALGKAQVGLSNRFLQVLEQEVGTHRGLSWECWR